MQLELNLQEERGEERRRVAWCEPPPRVCRRHPSWRGHRSFNSRVCVGLMVRAPKFEPLIGEALFVVVVSLYGILT